MVAALVRQRRRLLLATVAIALAVGYLAGALTLLDRVSNGLDRLAGAGAERADLVVEGEIAYESALEQTRRLVPATIAPSLEAVPGVVAHVRLGGAAQALGGVVGAGHGGPVEGEQLLHRGGHDLGQQVLLGRDVLVEARAADADRGADVGHGGGLVSAAGEQLQGRGADVVGPAQLPSPSG